MRPRLRRLRPVAQAWSRMRPYQKKSGSNGLDRQEDIPSTIGMVDIEFLSTSHGLFQATEGKFSG
jgi:hypothetical protein